jgi:outer membrane protein assembly factor BamB
MKMTKSKTIIIIAILIFAMTFSLFARPTNSQVPTLKTYPFVDAVPNPIGVNQEVLIRFGIFQQLGSVEFGWKGITITVTRPDNTIETLGPYTTDSTGGTAVLYTPTQVGTYKLVMHFPEQPCPMTFFNLEGGNMIFEGTIMKASTTDALNMVVQQEPLVPYPDQPLPTEYWTRPIDPQLRSWYSIAGNWIARPDNWFAPNNAAPETSHVLWTKPLDYYGGLTGGLLGPTEVPASHETGDAYEGKWQSSVIMNGILYYNRMPAGFAGSYQPQNGIFAVDLHTGKELWFRNNTWLSFGQILYFNSFNYDGVYSYLWDTTTPGIWKAYSPSTGEWLYSMTDVPAGTQYFGPNGEILILQADFANHWMALWNSTAAGQAQLTVLGDFGSWGRFVHGQTWNAAVKNAYSWNVSIPAGLQPGMSFFAPVLKVYSDRVMSIAFNDTQVEVWALNTKDLTKNSKSASLLFDKTWQAPAEWLAGSNTLHYAGATNDVANGVISVWNKELRKFYGFSTETGNYLWETNSEHFLDIYGFGNVEHTWWFAYNHLYSVGVAGTVYCYDQQTGKTLWTYNMTEPYNEVVTGDNWWGWITLISDGKLYVGTVEHSAEMPLPRGGPFICLNATTGDVIWRVNGMFRQTRWGGDAILGDSIIATMDTYDQRIYAVGKGPSATSVTAPEVSLTLGSSIVIRGTVTDISSGTKDDAITARFPNGVPAVSDDSMSDWMLYVYKQFERPPNTVGVDVSISVLDANGNFRNIGTTKSDANGFYTFQWTPDIQGQYTVYASFVGTKSYYGSYSQTSFAVDPAPTTAPTPIPQSGLATTAELMTYMVGGVIAIIIAIAIVGFLILRKHP